MPVWHELTKEARKAGELVLLGVIQEQHPDRCRLFAQWKGFDWPILHFDFALLRVIFLASLDCQRIASWREIRLKGMGG